MKVAQMMIKTVLTVIVTVIDPLFFFFSVLVLPYPLHFPPFYISCVPVMGGMTG